MRALVCAVVGALATPVAADYRLELIRTGMQDYYCSITVELTNETDAPLAEINGHFFSFVGEESVGRSRGASFLNVPAGTSAEASFLTPNAPCDDVTSYGFVIGACRFDTAFADRSECAQRIVPVPPISTVSAR